MARYLCSRRRLTLHTWQGIVNASPARRAGRPDRHRRPCQVRIVQGSTPYEDQMRSCLSLAKHRSSTAWAESAVHSVATVRRTRIVARRTYYAEGCRPKANANGSAASAQILAIAAPANPRRNRRLCALPANRTAKASACYRHFQLQGQSRGATAAQIVPSAAIGHCRLELLC